LHFDDNIFIFLSLKHEPCKKNNYLKEQERFSRFFTHSVLSIFYYRKKLISLETLTEKNTNFVLNAVTLLCYFLICHNFPMLCYLTCLPSPRRFVKEFERIKNRGGDTDHSVTCDKALVKSGQIEHGYFRNLNQVVCFEK